MIVMVWFPINPLKPIWIHHGIYSAKRTNPIKVCIMSHVDDDARKSRTIFICVFQIKQSIRIRGDQPVEKKNCTLNSEHARNKKEAMSSLVFLGCVVLRMYLALSELSCGKWAEKV